MTTQQRSRPAHLAAVTDAERASLLGADAVSAEVQQIFQAAQPALIASVMEKGVLHVVFHYITEDRVKMTAMKNDLIVRLAAIGSSAIVSVVGLLRFS